MSSPLRSKRKPNPIKDQIEEALKSALKDSNLPVVRDKNGDDQNKDARDRAIAILCGANALVEDHETGLYIAIWDIEEYGVEPLHEDVSLKSFSELEATALEWIWPGRIPRGKIVLFSGDPGCGKSMATIDITARITRNLSWPDGDGIAPPGEVLLISDEDDLEDTILPRLIAADADTSKVHFLKMRTTGVERTLNLSEDIKRLEGVLIAHPNIQVIILDPINNYVGKLDDRSDIRVRDVMMPLVRLARDLRISIICVKHLNKDASKSASYRTSGAGWVGIARQMWMFAPDPTNKEQFVMVSGKINLGPSIKGLAYKIRQRDGDLQAHIEWCGPTEVTAEEALAPAKKKGRGRPPKMPLEEVKQWILDSLLEYGGEMPSAKLSWPPGVSVNAFKEAKRLLGVRSEYRGTEKAWYLVLPKVNNDDLAGDLPEIAPVAESPRGL